MGRTQKAERMSDVSQANHAEWIVKCGGCKVKYTVQIPIPTGCIKGHPTRGLEAAETGRSIMKQSGWTQRKDLWWVCNKCNA